MSAAASFARVGALACQKDAFLRELTATVVSCEPAKSSGGKKIEKISGDAAGGTIYDVVLSDSVLFPEGGGQPCDHGTLRLVECDGSAKDTDGPAIPITNARRVGDKCVLSSSHPLPIGAAVHQVVDWRRRRDHMQHHTGQHLLTAVVERHDTLHLPTVSWSLTHPYCFIQVDVGVYANDPTSPYHAFLTKDRKISDDMVAKIEAMCNDAIVRSVAVQCDVFDSRAAYQQEQERLEKAAAADGGSAVGGFRSRGIPEDVTGPIRIISLDGIDSCTCCGTHLHSLAELQALYLLHQEVKNTTVKLYFITGDRAAQQFHAMYQRERQLMPDLGGTRPEDFVSVVQRRSKDAADMEKLVRRWTLELAGVEAQRIIASLLPPTVAHTEATDSSLVAVPLRRDDMELEFFTEVRAQLNAAGLRHVVLVSAWAAERCITGPLTNTKDVQGQLFITGGEGPEKVEQVAKLAKETLMGLKGGSSSHGFRGKGSLREWDAFVKRLQE